MNDQIKFLTAEQVLPLRAQVLRPGQPVTKAVMLQDGDATTFHLGLFSGDEIVCVATFHEDKKVNLASRIPYRLRGMATASHYQGRGAGKQILQAGVQELMKRNCDLVWCHAREKAFNFYEKCGFAFLGEMFDIPEIGPHKVMYKFLGKS